MKHWRCLAADEVREAVGEGDYKAGCAFAALAALGVDVRQDGGAVLAEARRLADEVKGMREKIDAEATEIDSAATGAGETIKRLREESEGLRKRLSALQSDYDELVSRCGALRSLADERQRLLDEQEPRLMPEGMEWPRFEDGEPVHFGDEFETPEETGKVSSIALEINGGYQLGYSTGAGKFIVVYPSGQRVKRLAPKVLDADGVEIRAGDTVYEVGKSEPMTVQFCNTTCGCVSCDHDGSAWVKRRTCGEWRGYTPPNPSGFNDDDGATLWCEHCDIELDEDWAFCPNCGAKVVKP